MSRHPWRMTIFALAAATVVGCAGEGPLARVGDRSIAAAEFRAYLEETTGMRWSAVPAPVASALLDQYLDEEVVLAAAGRPTGAHDAAERSETARRLLVELCGPPPRSGAATVTDGTDGGLGVRMRQLLLPDRDRAEEALARIRDGGSWEEVSAETSLAPNADSGGGLGVVLPGDLPPEFDPVFDLGAGELSPPMDGPTGVHVFQVTATGVAPPRPAGTDARATASRRHLERCVGRLAAAAGVRVDDRMTWFDYDGRYAEGADE